MLQEQPEVPAQSVHSNGAKQMVETFIHGSKTGDFTPFIRLLTAEAKLVTEGGGKVRAAIFPIFRKERVQTFLEAVVPRGFFQGEVVPAMVNGQMGAMVINNYRVEKVMSFEWDTNRQLIKNIYVVANTDKLEHIGI